MPIKRSNKCIVCRSRPQPSVSLFRFPNDKESVDLYCKNMNLNLEVIQILHSTIFICSQHFERNQLGPPGQRILRTKNAIPTLLPCRCLPWALEKTTESLKKTEGPNESIKTDFVFVRTESVLHPKIGEKEREERYLKIPIGAVTDAESSLSKEISNKAQTWTATSNIQSTKKDIVGSMCESAEKLKAEYGSDSIIITGHEDGTFEFYCTGQRTPLWVLPYWNMYKEFNHFKKQKDIPTEKITGDIYEERIESKKKEEDPAENIVILEKPILPFTKSRARNSCPVPKRQKILPEHWDRNQKGDTMRSPNDAVEQIMEGPSNYSTQQGVDDSCVLDSSDEGRIFSGPSATNTANFTNLSKLNPKSRQNMCIVKSNKATALIANLVNGSRLKSKQRMKHRIVKHPVNKTASIESGMRAEDIIFPSEIVPSSSNFQEGFIKVEPVDFDIEEKSNV